MLVLELVDQVENQLRLAQVNWGSGCRLMLGVSGGVDSMVLLRVMDRLVGHRGGELVIAHFNHQLRERESDLDEQLVLESAQRLGWACVVDRGDVKGVAEKEGISIEMSARRLRHKFLARVASDQSCRMVWLAHHADDQVELFLIRLLRGAGSLGLGGMRLSQRSPFAEGVTLVRPFLGTRKKSLLSFAREHGVAFREDLSNQDLNPLRNRIRHQLLPLLREQFNPAVEQNLLRAQEILSEEHRLISKMVGESLQGSSPPPFEGLPAAHQREWLRQELLRLRVVPEFDLIERLRHEPDGTRMMVADARLVCRDSSGRVHEGLAPQLEFSPEARVLELGNRPLPLQIEFGGYRMVFEQGRQGDPEFDPARIEGQSEVFDAELVGDRIRLRFWQAGDRFQPIGMPHSLKLQDWFTNEKISVSERRSRILVESAQGDLFWVVGMRIGERCRVTEGTLRVMRISWERQR